MTDFIQPPLVMERAKHKHECPMCHGYLRDRGGIWTCDWCGFEPDFEQRAASVFVPIGDGEEWTVIPVIGSVRLGASLQELAKETIESIMGYQGHGGHKPPRPDIQKMKEVHDEYLWKQNFNHENPYGWDSYEDADRNWDEKYQLSREEVLVVQSYCNFYRVYHQNPERAFQAVIGALMQNKAGMPFFAIDPDDGPAEAMKAAKKMLGGALKKYEQQNWGELYAQIKNSLDDVYRRGPIESYKLWPRMVAWLKDAYLHTLFSSPGAINRPDSFSFQSTARHIEDIVTEGGKIIDQLRRENRLPQGFDVNKISFEDFEKWLMEWKHENLGAENAGQVVYQFHDGWTIQKLTTPEQLQFEGDEMGHCVGGYAHSVGEGRDIIYSLRDPKGMPHVTIEMTALEGAPSYGFGGEEPPEDAIFNHEYIHPDAHAPGDHMEESVTRGDNPYAPSKHGYTPTGETPFEIVQVQGNSNKTPKPEYQRKIKEFLDSLREKGWKFVRSDNWFAPFDDPAQDEYGDGAPASARQLDEWYDDHYKTHHEAYRGVGESDAYGLPAERAKIGIDDWQSLFQDIFGSLVEEYDPGRWRGNWRDLAQAVFHAWFIDIYKDHLDGPALKKHKENLVHEIEDAEQTLHEWNDNNWDYAQEHVQDEIAEAIKDKAQASGKLDSIEAALNEEYGEDMWDDTELLDWVRDNDEDLYYEASDKIRDDATDAYAGDAYKFCNYLVQLAEKFGGVNPADLPNPNDRHGGLPSYEELQEMPWKHDDFEQNEHPMGNMNLPGALSHWKTSSVVQLDWDDLPPEHGEWLQGANDKGISYATPGDDRPDIRTPAMHYPHEDLLVVGQPGWTHGDIDEALKHKGMGQAYWGIEHAWHAGDPSLDVPPRWNVQEDSTFHRYFEPDESDRADGTSLVPHRDDYLKQVWPLLQEARPGPLYRGINMVRQASGQVPIEIHPIDHEHNVWFDTDGNQRARFRPGWAKNPTTGKMEQTGELEDTFLDRHGRQGQGFVAYHGDRPVGSLTYVDDSGWHMLGTAFVHPDYREQGLFNRLAQPLRETGRPIDAYVWENPWLKQKVRSWR